MAVDTGSLHFLFDILSFSEVLECASNFILSFNKPES